MRLTESTNIKENVLDSGNEFIVCDREWIEKEVLKRKDGTYVAIGHLKNIRVVTSAMPCGEVSKLEKDNVYEREYQIWYDQFDQSKEIASIIADISKLKSGETNYNSVREKLIQKISDYITSMGYYDFEKKHITGLWI